ncbi:hypothetical protein ACF08N_03420 [Streptomyces sp. NPDC015127]
MGRENVPHREMRDPDKELSVRQLAAGRAVFLGSFEDGVNSY